MIKLGNIELKDLKRGTTFINKVYIGIHKVWERFLGYQNVFAALPEGIISKSDMWYYKSFGGADVDVLIESVCGTSDGAVKVTFSSLSGITITSHLGSATPTINGNSIEYSVGSILYLELSNGSTYNFKEGAGNIIYDSSGNGSHGTIEFTTAGIQPYPSQAFLQALAEFWGERSAYAEPVERFGYNPALSTNSAIIGAHTAMPDGSNVGSEKIVNGMFNSWDAGVPFGWVAVGDGVNSGVTEHLGGLRIFSVNGDNAGVNQPLLIDIQVKIEYTIKEYIEGQLKVPLWDGTTDLTVIPTDLGKHVVYGKTSSDLFYIYKEGSTCDITIDDISVKEVLSISAYGEWEFTVLKQASSLYVIQFISPVPLPADGIDVKDYRIQLGNDGVLYLVRDGTTKFKTVPDYIKGNISYDIKVIRTTVGEFSVFIKGGEYGTAYILVQADTGTNPIVDNLYTTSKFSIVNMDAGDLCLNFKYDGHLFELKDFSTLSGEASFVNVIGVDGIVDVLGNELSVLPNSGASNSGAILKQPDNDTQLAKVDIVNSLGWYDGSGVAQPITWDMIESYKNSATFKRDKVGLNIVDMVSANIVDTETGTPLEDHSLWELVDNEQGGDSHYSWGRYGKDIIPHVNVNPAAKAQNLKFNDVSAVSATITTDVVHVPAGTTWALLFAKFLSYSDIIGVRINADKVEIVQRDAGVWTTKYSEIVTPLIGAWRVEITDTDITVYINNKEITTVAHSIAAMGAFGISGHRYDDDTDTVLLENYNVEIIN